MLDGPPPVQPVDPGFIADLRTALAVWRRSPWMPVAGVLLSLWLSLQDVFGYSNGLVFVLTLPAMIVSAAWPGVERLWYLRMFRGERLRIRETRGFVGAYFWRYAILGLVAFVPVTILYLVLLAASPTAGRIGVVAMVLALDIVLTFVTPALAYTTRRVRIALRVLLDMIRDEWPRCMWYVLAPPLAIAALSQLDVGPERGTGLRMALTVTIPLLGLACKGAIAVFYLRRWPTGFDGAAFVDADVPLPASTRTPFLAVRIGPADHPGRRRAGGANGPPRGSRHRSHGTPASNEVGRPGRWPPAACRMCHARARVNDAA